MKLGMAVEILRRALRERTLELGRRLDFTLAGESRNHGDG